MELAPGTMKLGATYNVFDAEELLEASIKSIKSNVEYVVVVYQTVSNFGNKCNPHLEDLLQDLKQRNVIDELVHYTPREFSAVEKLTLVSARVSERNRNVEKEVGGSSIAIADVFFNEQEKREIGRRKCKEAGCTHFMTLDAGKLVLHRLLNSLDEFFLESQLKTVKEKIMANGYDATACRMRTFFKEPIYEYYPRDSMNCVPLIYKIEDGLEFRIAAPYPAMIDPTRRIDNYKSFHLFERDDIEMYHYTFVRKDIKMKLQNVSNRGNYSGMPLSEFFDRFEKWKEGDAVLHPHPYIGSFFKEIRKVENTFNIQLDQLCKNCSKSQNIMKCGRCKKVRYCSVKCQKEDWALHKPHCVQSKTP